MAENKTKPTDADVGAFLDAVEPERRREEARVLSAIIGKLSGFAPRIWGDGIVGFGSYRYRYKSAHGGESFLTGLSPRKSAMTVYVMPGFEPYEDMLSRLGPHRRSVSCLYLPRLDKIDLDILETMLADSIGRMKMLYPDWSA